MYVKDSFTEIWWFSKTERPYADNRKILSEYSKGMLKLLERQKYNAGKRATCHNINKKSFLTKNKGAIPPNIFAKSGAQNNIGAWMNKPIIIAKALKKSKL